MYPYLRTRAWSPSLKQTNAAHAALALPTITISHLGLTHSSGASPSSRHPLPVETLHPAPSHLDPFAVWEKGDQMGSNQLQHQKAPCGKLPSLHTVRMQEASPCSPLSVAFPSPVLFRLSPCLAPRPAVLGSFS